MARLLRLNLIFMFGVIVIISVIWFGITNADNAADHKDLSKPSGKNCQTLRIPLCKQLEAYTDVHLPNVFGQTSQDSARNALRRFLALFAKDNKCSRTLKPFLCYLYAPPCSTSGGNAHRPATMLSPCRGLCEAARSSCESPMNKQGLAWPIQFECAAFPSHACLGLNGTKLIPTPPEPGNVIHL